MPPPSTTPLLLGTSPAMVGVRRFLERACQVDAAVLLLGETGTGKSVLARAIHANGARASAPFVALNCAAVPEALFESELFGHRRGAFTGAHEDRPGLLEAAHGGTVLLDEIGDLPAGQQAKLLTVLEEGEVRPVGARRPVRVDVRVMSATACAMDQSVRDGVFRRDLFHRLAVLTFRLPPLRERVSDLPRLTDHFLRAAARRHRLRVPRVDEGAVRLLGSHSWPGNVRELAHAVEASLILARNGGFADALRGVLGGAPSAPSAAGPERPGPSVGGGDRYSFYGTDDEERAHIASALARCRGNRTRAASEMGMSRNTLRARMRRYGL